jgi:predicted permease
MVILFVLLVLVVFGMSVRRLRRSRKGRWPFLASAALTGLLVVLSAGGAVVALAGGRGRWNHWTAATPHRESMTLSLLVLGLPTMLALASLLFLLGSLHDRREGVRQER